MSPDTQWKAHDESGSGVDLITETADRTPTLLTWSYDGTVHLWNTITRKRQGSLMQGHNKHQPKRSDPWNFQVDVNLHKQRNSEFLHKSLHGNEANLSVDDRRLSAIATRMVDQNDLRVRALGRTIVTPKRKKNRSHSMHDPKHQGRRHKQKSGSQADNGQTFLTENPDASEEEMDLPPTSSSHSKHRRRRSRRRTSSRQSGGNRSGIQRHEAWGFSTGADDTGRNSDADLVNNANSIIMQRRKSRSHQHQRQQQQRFGSQSLSRPPSSAQLRSRPGTASSLAPRGGYGSRPPSHHSNRSAGPRGHNAGMLLSQSVAKLEVPRGGLRGRSASDLRLSSRGMSVSASQPSLSAHYTQRAQTAGPRRKVAAIRKKEKGMRAAQRRLRKRRNSLEKLAAPLLQSSNRPQQTIAENLARVAPRPNLFEFSDHPRLRTPVLELGKFSVHVTPGQEAAAHDLEDVLAECEAMYDPMHESPVNTGDDYDF